MNDQYGNKVPDDLVLLPSIELLNEQEIKMIVDADWYDAYTGKNYGFGAFLCISAKDIDYLSEEAIEDYAEKPIKEILQVNDVLKRWSIEDGFYHA